MRLSSRLFSLGFLTLFLELVLIRYLSGNIWNLGYFPNLILLAVFVGMGVGFSFHSRVDFSKSEKVFRFVPILLFILVLVATVGNPALPGFDSQQAEFGGELFFTTRKSQSEIVALLLLVFWFSMTAVIFASISQFTAKLFSQFAPLKAYTLDILGSCAGILCFMAFSFFQVPAPVWLFLLVPLYLACLGGSLFNRKTLLVPLVSFALCALVAYGKDLLVFSNRGDSLSEVEVRWSPYQKVKYLEHTNGLQQITVNGIPHQEMERIEKIRKIFYQGPYEARKAHKHLAPYKRVLILGAGSGNDVAAALDNGAEEVDAVEIDPVLVDLGRKHHTAKPYADPRVTVTVDDGRAFMVRSKKKYDLIVFALTDSLVKVSALGQLRLENYLFTKEAITRANKLLAPAGDLVFYNFYRKPWLTQKIEQMIYQGTGIYPKRLMENGDFVVIAAGTANSAPVPAAGELYDPPTDDWPFLYLKYRGIPTPYIAVMLFLLMIILIPVFFLKSPDSEEELPSIATRAAFLLMGLAFLLLETKSVIQFALLFGTTWVNNSLVFLGVLLSVLLANWTAEKFKLFKASSFFFFLLVSCAIPLIYPLSNLLEIENYWVRFVCASTLTFLPIYFANIIFSIYFRSEKRAENLFGWNLLGAGLGGVTEYISLLMGYRFLAVLIIACYALVYLSLTFPLGSLSGRFRRLAEGT